jgi:hypothetical protein
MQTTRMTSMMIACVLAGLLGTAHLAGCGREDVPLDSDDGDGGEDAEGPRDGGLSDAPPTG